MTETTMTATDVRSIAPIDHDEAMALATTETARLLDLLGSLSDDEWARPTQCPEWQVRDIAGHLLGMWKLQVDADLRATHIGEAREAAQASGRIWLDELTARQVRDHAGLSTRELVDEMRALAPTAIAARRAMTEEFRRTPYEVSLPGEGTWTFGYLFDVIHTRDPWLHRAVDISRAIARAPELTPDHDGRLIADVVREWAQRHGSPFTLTLTGPAGGTFTSGTAGETHELDAVEFCRILSGRAEATGLLRVPVPF
jgi:uncharacterized protein (TIGR03083 family)